MAVAVWRYEVEKTVEQRLERLEVHVEHIQSDVTESKAQIKEMDQRLTGKIDALDERLTGKIDALDERLTGKIDALDQRVMGKIDHLIEAVSDLRVGRAFDRVWFLLMGAALLGILAKAFKWI